MDKPKQCVKCKYFKAETSPSYTPNTIYTCKHADMPIRSIAATDTDVLYSFCPIKEDNER